jgi:serine/threonine protein kinase/Flp pilus assembly protein TadD
MGSSNGHLSLSRDPDFDLELDGYVVAFESAALRGDADLTEFLPPAAHPKYPDVLCELVRIDLEFAWGRGDERRAEHYRDRFPALFVSPVHLRAVAAEEFRLRQAAGDDPDPLEYRARLGVDLTDCDPGPRTEPLPPVEWTADRPPGVGDTIPPGFTLDAELGAGGFGRVFLARQADLAGRCVAVKISSRLIGESQVLARLQHTNIVPVYSVHRVGRWTALVMPFLGRTTLVDLIDEVRRSGVRPLSGRAVVSTLVDRAARTASTPDAPPAPAPAAPVSQAALDRLARLGHIEAVLWVGSELADGLAHAHDRGILHRDVKPANVLFTDDGRPMLLDFNLAADIDAPADGAVGGTARYMAPEQLTAFRDHRGAHSVRSDVYSLGLVLVELLAGRLPFESHTGPLDAVITRMIEDRSRPFDLSALPPDTPSAVASVLGKCLAPAPADRYASAADLREDLLRQLANRPLKFAPEWSVRERVRKWARRHPRLSSVTTLSLVAMAVLAATVTVFLDRQRRLETLDAERSRDDLRAAVAAAYEPAGPAAETCDLRNRLTDVLDRYGVDRDGWADGLLVRRLSDADRLAVRRDLAFGMAASARLSGHLAATAPSAERSAALRSEAESWRERAKRLGQNPAGESTLGARRTGLAERVADLRNEARSASAGFATWMKLGLAELRLGRVDAAIEAFTLAAGADPRMTWPYYHRGAARILARRYADAEQDFDHFLTLRPEVPEAHHNRGLARLNRGDARGAIADFDEAERLGSATVELFDQRSRARRKLGDAAGADRDQTTALVTTPTTPNGWATRGELKLAVRPDDPKAALADFDSALVLDPDHLPALRDKASVLSERLGRPADAVAALDRVLELAPHSTDDRAGRAVLLARLGMTAEARKDAEACALSDNPLTLYQAGCAVLLGDPADTARGLTLLRAALRRDPTWAAHMPTDPDLKRVWGDPAFRELVSAAGVLAGKK